MEQVLATALICAALLMGEPVPRTELLYQDRPVPLTARGCGDGKCLAVTTNAADLWIVIGRRQNIGWSEAVHEACHRVQHVRNGRMSEAECYAIQKRAGDCNASIDHRIRHRDIDR